MHRLDDAVSPVLVEAAETFRLTRRELQVLQRLLDGERTSDVAAHLGIAACTVTSYEQALMTKTGSHSRAQMVARVLGWPNQPAAAPAPSGRVPRSAGALFWLSKAARRRSRRVAERSRRSLSAGRRTALSVPSSIAYLQA